MSLDRGRVGDRRPNLNTGVALTETFQEPGEQVFAGGRARGQEQFSDDKGFQPSYLVSRGLVEGEDLTCQRVKSLARLGQLDSAAAPVEEGNGEFFFEGLDALANRGL